MTSRVIGYPVVTVVLLSMPWLIPPQVEPSPVVVLGWGASLVVPYCYGCR